MKNLLEKKFIVNELCEVKTKEIVNWSNICNVVRYAELQDTDGERIDDLYFSEYKLYEDELQKDMEKYNSKKEMTLEKIIKKGYSNIITCLYRAGINKYNNPAIMEVVEDY